MFNISTVSNNVNFGSKVKNRSRAIQPYQADSVCFQGKTEKPKEYNWFNTLFLRLSKEEVDKTNKTRKIPEGLALKKHKKTIIINTRRMDQYTYNEYYTFTPRNPADSTQITSLPKGCSLNNDYWGFTSVDTGKGYIDYSPCVTVPLENIFV